MSDGFAAIAANGCNKARHGASERIVSPWTTWTPPRLTGALGRVVTRFRNRVNDVSHCSCSFFGVLAEIAASTFFGKSLERT